MKNIDPETLVDMEHAGRAIRVDLVYSNADHPENLFGQVYRKGAKLWLHPDLARIVTRAAADMHSRHGHVFVLKDGLRTVEAQQKMMDTPIVASNPHWIVDGPDRLLSPPGMGGHPRAMAVDIVLEDAHGNEVPMGTRFDHLSTDPADNPAKRDYAHFAETILANRKLLENAMMRAADHCGLPLLPLPSEWWDFRFTAEYYSRYAPIYDSGLPAHMRMTGFKA